MLGFAALAALVLITAAVSLMVVAHARRRAVLQILRERYPLYANALEARTPGRLTRSTGPRLDRFLHDHHDRDIDDPELTERCEALRRIERRAVALLVAGLVAFGLAIWAARGG